MLFGWFLCLLVALIQVRSGETEQVTYDDFHSRVLQKLSTLAKKPLLLGGSTDVKTQSDLKDVLQSAKNLFNVSYKKISVHIRDATMSYGGRLQEIVQRLAALRQKFNATRLSNTERMVLNHMVSEGLLHDAMKAIVTVQDKIMRTLDTVDGSPTAKLLLAQVVNEELNDISKKQVKKLATQLAEHQDNNGVSDDGVSDDGVSDDGVLDDTVSDDGVSDDGVHDDGVSDDGVSDDGVSDDAVYDSGVYDDGVADDPAPAMLNNGKRGTKKMCMYTPYREYCVKQAKGL